MLKRIFYNWKTLFSILLGVFITLALVWFMRVIREPAPVYNKNNNYHTIKMTTNDTIFQGDFKDSLNQLICSGVSHVDSINQITQEHNVRHEEKFNSINNRFSDLYTLGAVIITLLVLINIGTIVSTKGEVEKYFEEHHKSIQDDLEKKLTEAENLVGRIEVQFKLAKEKTDKIPDTKTGG